VSVTCHVLSDMATMAEEEYEHHLSGVAKVNLLKRLERELPIGRQNTWHKSAGNFLVTKSPQASYHKSCLNIKRPLYKIRAFR
jgi:hypothetical protein